jgi:hypothetical protein
MSVETGPETLLVEEVGNQPDTSAKNEETIEDTHLEVILGFFGRECTAVADEIDEANSDSTETS